MPLTWNIEKSGKHNGWTNRETWLVYTGIVNDREKEAYWMAKAKEARHPSVGAENLATLMQNRCRDIQTPRPIDWKAIADMLIHESIALSSPEEESNE